MYLLTEAEEKLLRSFNNDHQHYITPLMLKNDPVLRSLVEKRLIAVGNPMIPVNMTINGEAHCQVARFPKRK